MSVLRLAGKVLGLSKTLVIAAFFGTSAALDAFWVAYALPMLLPGLVRGVVATAFIPGFMRSSRDGVDAVDWRGLNTLFTLVALLIVLIAVLAVVGRHPLVTFMAPGLEPATHDLAADLVALMAVAVLFFGLNAILSAVLQALHRFVVMSLESVVTNVVIIAGCIYSADEWGVYGLTVSVIAGFALHGVMLAWVNRDLLRRHLRPALHVDHADFREPARHMFPLMVGYLGSIAMMLIDRMFVSTLESGMISVLAFASMIALLPMEVFGQAVMTAFYPAMSRDHANGDLDGLRDTHVKGVRLLLFVLLPTTAALVLAAEPFTSLLLQRGAFSPDAAGVTAATLAALSLGLAGRAVNYLNFRVFHARQEPWTAVFIGLFGVALNAILDWMLIDTYGIVGIGFATSIAMTASALLSTLLLQRRLAGHLLGRLASPLLKLVLMTAAFLAAAWLCRVFAAAHTGTLADWQASLLSLALLAPAALVFLLAGALLNLHESRALLGYLVRGRRQGAAS